MPNLTPEDVMKVAALAQLEVKPEELAHFSERLSGVLQYVEILNQVETDGVAPLAHPFEVVNVFREDVLTEMLSREAALQNAPKSDGKYFVVPAILDAAE